MQFQAAWDAGDNLEAIMVAQRLKSQCDQAGKREVSNSLDALIKAAVDENHADYNRAVDKFLDACRSEFTASSQIEPVATKHRKRLEVLSRLADAKDPILSDLPMGDADFREIAADFVPQLESKLRELDAAVASVDFEEVAAIAHWLKGAGGTCGFGQFTEPSTGLELAAKSAALPGCEKHVELLWYMGSQIVIAPNEIGAS